VRDHDHRGRLAAQPGFEPHHGVQVEVIGRLVEQQQVGRSQQCAGEREPVAPASRELRDRAAAVRCRKPQAVHHRRGLRDDRPFVEFRQRGKRVRQPHLVVAGFGSGQFGARAGQRRMAGDDIVERALATGLDVLRNVGDAFGRRRLERAGFEPELAQDRREQRRLAATVGADQPDALAGAPDQRDAAVQRARAAASATSISLSMSVAAPCGERSPGSPCPHLRAHARPLRRECA
jgi:hypothetical protein